jgi:hypothetical protein
MLIDYYPTKSQEKLKAYLEVYIPLITQVAGTFDVDLQTDGFAGDHIGLQVLSKEEFEDGSKFFKTKLVNLVEIEFRNDCLGVKQ